MNYYSLEAAGEPVFDENSVIKKYLITATDGKHYDTKHYNLQAIIAVGFKISNDRAVRFRKWAGQIVKDYTIQGWTMDKERLKYPTTYWQKRKEQMKKEGNQSVTNCHALKMKAIDG